MLIIQGVHLVEKITPLTIRSPNTLMAASVFQYLLGRNLSSSVQKHGAVNNIVKTI